MHLTPWPLQRPGELVGCFQLHMLGFAQGDFLMFLLGFMVFFKGLMAFLCFSGDFLSLWPFLRAFWRLFFSRVLRQVCFFWALCIYIYTLFFDIIVINKYFLILLLIIILILFIVFYYYCEFGSRLKSMLPESGFLMLFVRMIGISEFECVFFVFQDRYFS